MKIGFFGTPEIAAYYLNRLIESHTVEFVVTGEDKPRGRHGTPSPGPVKEIALQKHIPFFQPQKLLDEDFLKAIFEFNADVYVVIAYAKKIPSVIFKKTPYGMINIHPSLLPKYRGAAPMQWALINGERETGVTIQYISEGWDTGDILAQKKIPVNIDMTFGDLYDMVLPIGYDLLIEVLYDFQSGKSNPVKQNDIEATYCGKLDKDTSRIDWGKSALEIHNLVRGLNPKPVAWTLFKGNNVKIYRTKLADDIIKPDQKSGYLEVIKKRLFAGTGSGIIEILELKPEAKKIMDGSSFINGYRLNAGDFFEN